jgi:dipeptidyl aminopeptidase/acylaminoacyl peptidase
MLPCLTDPSDESDSITVLADDYAGTIWEMDWIDDRILLVSSQEGTDGIIGTFDLESGTVRKLTSTAIEWGWPNNWSVDAAKKRVVFKKAAEDRAEDLWMMNTDGSEQRCLTDLNPQVKEWTLGTMESITWTSPDGTMIEGVLIKPAGYVPGRTYPLITILHGGPEWSWWYGWHAAWHQWGQLLASNGYTVLLPNPRGSNGYGWEFVEANSRDWGGGDLRDVLAGIDHVIESGVADSTRLGLCGWSYGGYLTAWAVTQTNLFKAAVMGAGPTDLVSFYDVTPCQSVFDAYFGVSAHADKDRYKDRSPLYYVEDVRTPLLILHGKNDFGVDVSQAQILHGALMREGKRVHLEVYPGEGHHFHQRDNQIDSMNRILAWFDKYL